MAKNYSLEKVSVEGSGSAALATAGVIKEMAQQANANVWLRILEAAGKAN